MKSEVTASRLKRAILISTERHHLEQQVRESHDQLRRLAEQDSLTGLSNRYFFDEALRDALPKASRNGKAVGLLLLDLDRFKNINDTLGHDAGDRFLQEVARRLEVPVRQGDKLCRLGGDEFAVLVHGLDQPDKIKHLVERIFESLSQPVQLAGKGGSDHRQHRCRPLPGMRAQPGRTDEVRRHRHVPRQSAGPQSGAVLLTRHSRFDRKPPAH